MKRLLYWLYLLVKRQLKNPVIVVVLIAMPVAALIITNTASLKEKEPVRVGIVLEDDDKIAIMTRDYLVNGNYSVQFYEAESQEKLEQDIMNKYTECGYVVGTGLKDKLDSGSYRDIIELIICRSDFVSSMTDEIFFSAMFKAYSPEVAVNYVDSVDIFKKHSEKAEEEIRKGYEEYISGDDTFRIDFKVLDGVQDNGTQLEDKTKELGNEWLLEQVRSVDPASAEAIHANNTKRLIRALEYFKLTGRPISEHNEKQRQKESPYNFCYFVLNRDRAELYRRIDLRVDQMMEQGLLKEVEALKAMGYDRSYVSMQGLGYKELLSYLDGECTLDDAVSQIKQSTRHFAKRQLTWFRRERDVTWLDIDGAKRMWSHLARGA